MSVFLPWIRIFLAVLAYILFALLASVIVRRIGKDLKEMEGRSSINSSAYWSDYELVRPGNHNFIVGFS